MPNYILNPTDTVWNEFVSVLNTDFYHTPGYNLLEARRLHGKSEAFYFKDGNKILFIPYIIREIDKTEWFDVTSAYGYPQPTLSSNAINDIAFCEYALNQFLNTLENKRIVTVFIRLHPLIPTNYDFWMNNGELIKHGRTVFLDLSIDEKKMWEKIRKRFHSNINRLRKDDAITVVRSWKYYSDFKDLYKSNMDRVNADDFYYFSDEYFFALRSILKDNISLVSILRDSEVMGSAIFTEFNRIVQYHLGATNSKFINASPMKMLIYEASKMFKNRGNKYLHLGGGLGGYEDSLFHFKTGFSSFHAPYHTWRKVVNKDQYNNLNQKLLNTYTLNEFNKTDSFFPLYRK